MSDPTNNNQVQMTYPSYMPTAYEDEINLVDLWIALKGYKKQFFMYCFIVFLLMVGALFSFYKTQYELSSSLQIGTVELEGAIRSIESLEAAKSKLENVLIPLVTQQWIIENNLKSKFKTSASSDKGSDVILLTNKIIKEDTLLFSNYQKKVLSLIIDDHEKKLNFTQTYISRSLRKEALALSILKDPLTLEIQLQEHDLEIKNSGAKLEALKENYKLLLKGGYEGVLSMLSADQLSEVMMKDGRIIDQLLRVRYETFLLDNKNEQQQLLNSIALSKLSKIKIKKAHDELIKESLLKIKEIKLTLSNVNRSHILSEPLVSIEPAGLSMKVLLVLSLFVSVFIAFIGVLFAMFRDKVADRMEESA